MLTPDDVHHHRAPDVLAKRGRTLQAAWALHPERFVHGTPKPAPASRSRLDQPTRHFHNRRNESVNRNRRCLKVVDRFRNGYGRGGRTDQIVGQWVWTVIFDNCPGAGTLRGSIIVVGAVSIDPLKTCFVWIWRLHQR